MLPYRRLFKYRMGRYSGSYDISPKYRLIIRYSIYRSIAIPSSIDIDRSQVSRYFDISSIEPALVEAADMLKVTKLALRYQQYIMVEVVSKRARNPLST